ncbi:ThuA domain-containing protein [Rathayibacter soli]|uniref:ThuA domain-containing protein n=1 Tax=Rathayibacter soli TaxID=3144168 RepID=UPI0027E5BC23|nr:ThuA domain-containing protein [Glaciibacter superstes]
MEHHQWRATILSGAGRYADPWHPFSETSECISAILRDAGFAVEISERVDERMRALATAETRTPDLLVVNVGNPSDPDPADAATRAGLLAYLNAGGTVLAMHVSATSFPAIPEWESIVGGIWVRGTTMHPDAGLARIHVYPDRHAIVAPLNDFELIDERYSYLRVDPGVVPLATHEHGGLKHPLFWAWHYGSARVVYDALGHDAASFESATHRQLVRRAALWLVDGLEADAGTGQPATLGYPARGRGD